MSEQVIEIEMQTFPLSSSPPEDEKEVPAPTDLKSSQKPVSTASSSDSTKITQVIEGLVPYMIRLYGPHSFNKKDVFSFTLYYWEQVFEKAPECLLEHYALDLAIMGYLQSKDQEELHYFYGVIIDLISCGAKFSPSLFDLLMQDADKYNQLSEVLFGHASKQEYALTSKPYVKQLVTKLKREAPAEIAIIGNDADFLLRHIDQLPKDVGELKHLIDFSEQFQYKEIVEILKDPKTAIAKWKKKQEKQPKVASLEEELLLKEMYLQLLKAAVKHSDTLLMWVENKQQYFYILQHWDKVIPAFTQRLNQRNKENSQTYTQRQVGARVALLMASLFTLRMPEVFLSYVKSLLAYGADIDDDVISNLSQIGESNLITGYKGRKLSPIKQDLFEFVNQEMLLQSSHPSSATTSQYGRFTVTSYEQYEEIPSPRQKLDRVTRAKATPEVRGYGSSGFFEVGKSTTKAKPKSSSSRSTTKQTRKEPKTEFTMQEMANIFKKYLTKIEASMKCLFEKIPKDLIKNDTKLEELEKPLAEKISQLILQWRELNYYIRELKYLRNDQEFNDLNVKLYGLQPGSSEYRETYNAIRDFYCYDDLERKSSELPQTWQKQYNLQMMIHQCYQKRFNTIPMHPEPNRELFQFVNMCIEDYKIDVGIQPVTFPPERFVSGIIFT